jgi:hypothetical protein
MKIAEIMEAKKRKQPIDCVLNTPLTENTGKKGNSQSLLLNANRQKKENVGLMGIESLELRADKSIVTQGIRIQRSFGLSKYKERKSEEGKSGRKERKCLFKGLPRSGDPLRTKPKSISSRLRPPRSNSAVILAGLDENPAWGAPNFQPAPQLYARKSAILTYLYK